MKSDLWVLLEAYPTDPTPTLQRLFGHDAQVGLIYVCWFIKVYFWKSWLGDVNQALFHLRCVCEKYVWSGWVN